MSTVCTITGSPNLYGLGIRVSFYLLWFFIPLAERWHERHAQVPRTAELILAYAVFIGLVLAVSDGYLFAVEVYVALLLISTTVFLLVPRHTRYFVGWIRPDLGLGTRRGSFGIVGAIRFLFVLIVVSLHLWFWSSGVESTSIDRNLRNLGGCCPCQPPQQLGFAFGPVDMHSGGFRTTNGLLMLGLLLGGLLVGAMKAGVIRRKSRFPIAVLKEVQTFGGLTVASLLVAAIELTIQWNGISAGVNQVNTATQLIPLGIVIGLILAFLYDLRNGCPGRGETSSRGSNTTGGRSGNGNGGIDPTGSSTPRRLPGPSIPRRSSPATSPADSPAPSPAPAPASSPPPATPPPPPPVPTPPPNSESSDTAQPPGAAGPSTTAEHPATPEPHQSPAPTTSAPTNPSSTDIVASSSSPSKHKSKSKEKSLQSFRERLKTPAKKLTRLSPVDEHYLRTATNLHTQATMRLSQTHADLNRKLTQSLVKDDEAFLADTEARIKKLSQPLDKFRIRSQQRDGDGALRTEENNVGELVARAEEQVRQFEKDMAALWKEWAVAEGEITEAEEEVVEIGEEAVAMMKEVEKSIDEP
ncbi:hypothetical protein C8A03DRAFT_41518 [Achaetomium macrosporum]|uniref:Uncharacterized protein n=1 Tax=Achaetomium macrosporum TaxID=79813 RepID=A0AAN7CF94_9PEZI|nr:hypothetical protein C8A03DRAFT_41518 [Achaetomium macrosporum]